jgi:hypothetical protein
MNINTQTRLLAILLGMSIVPAVFIGIYAYRTSTKSVTAKLAASAEETIRLLDRNMTAEFSRYSLFIDAISHSALMQDTLVAGGGAAELAEAIESINFPDSYFRYLYVLDKDGNSLYGADYRHISVDGLRKLIAGADTALTKNSLTQVGSTRAGNLAIGRKIYAQSAGEEHIGYVFAFFNDVNVYEMYEKESFGGGKMALLTADGVAICGSLAAPSTYYGTSELFKLLKQAHEEGKQSFFAEAYGVPSLVVYSYNQDYDTYLLAAIPLSYINEDARGAGRGIAIMAATSATFCVALSLWVYHNIEKRKRELELRALQYQISPHFLFNTLGTLKWIAVNNDAPFDVSNGITSLTQLLQSVLLGKDAMIPLREELDNLRHYFTLQQIRYGDCFQVVYEVDETTLEHRVPRFILQPLAENAVLHGTEGGGRRIVITVKCTNTDGGVLLEMADDGVGFEQIRPTGIGISNVDERLRLHYGRSHRLKVKSAIGKGTVCRVLVPQA